MVNDTTPVSHPSTVGRIHWRNSGGVHKRRGNILLKQSITAAGITVLAAGVVACAPLEEATDTAKTAAADAKKQAKEKVEETISVSRQNALKAAEQYLDTGAFSKQGLIEQLSSEYGSGFPKRDAQWAVNQLDVDWDEQAVKAAEQYLDTGAFSRQGLIEQLSSEYGSQFTKAQAQHAADEVGL